MAYAVSGGAPAPGRLLAPSDFFPIAPGPAPGVVGALVGAPVEASGPSALCACNPADTTPRSVKIEVLSTAYNSSSTDTIKYNAYLTFSHPVQSLNSSQIRVFTRQTGEDGSKTTVPGVVTTLAPVSNPIVAVALPLWLWHPLCVGVVPLCMAVALPLWLWRPSCVWI